MTCNVSRETSCAKCGDTIRFYARTRQWVAMDSTNSACSAYDVPFFPHTPTETTNETLETE